jgi:UDP-N-acetylglucosamine 2-epimerase (non-hydrolysing)
MINRRIWIVVGTRPNFIKVTRFKQVAESMEGFDVKIVHTGQHYDDAMAKVFFEQFGLQPDVFLNIKASHPGMQIGETITALTELFLREKPDMVMVVGDVNSTLAGAIAANKCNIPLAHLESGLRSKDPSMPEEHNRRLADALAQLHFITEDAGLANLRAEGAQEKGLAFVGNTMIDTLVAYHEKIESSQILAAHNLKSGSYALITLHRPSNVDTPQGLKLVLQILRNLSEKVKLVFPVHPRTLTRIEEFGLKDEFYAIPKLQLINPQGYFDFQKLIAGCVFTLTDSGGIQEETTYLRKPCLTLRPNTERPCTVSVGSNTLLPFAVKEIIAYADKIIAGKYKQSNVPPLWDGHATERVLERIALYMERNY